MNPFKDAVHFKAAYLQGSEAMRQPIVAEIRKKATAILDACFTKNEPEFPNIDPAEQPDGLDNGQSCRLGFANNDDAICASLEVRSLPDATFWEKNAANLLSLCVHWQEGRHELADKIFDICLQQGGDDGNSRLLSKTTGKD